MLEKIIYLVGSPRSGSSLIYNAICSHNIFNPSIPENHISANFTKYCFQQIQRNYDIEKKNIFNSENDTKDFFKSCLEIFFNKISNKYNIKHLVLKSIILTSDIYFLHLIYPQIFYVMTVREPRDIVTSMINLGTQQEKLGEKNKYPRNIKMLCQRINHLYRLVLEKELDNFFKKSVCLVKYEDFVINPSTTLNKIVKKFSININYNKNLNVWKRSSDLYQENIDNKNISYQSYKSSLWNKPIESSRIGIYKELLSDSEINDINFYSKDIIKYFNY